MINCELTHQILNTIFYHVKLQISFTLKALVFETNFYKPGYFATNTLFHVRKRTRILHFLLRSALDFQEIEIENWNWNWKH